MIDGTGGVHVPITLQAKSQINLVVLADPLVERVGGDT
jgi:hypothetical protein